MMSLERKIKVIKKGVFCERLRTTIYNSECHYKT